MNQRADSTPSSDKPQHTCPWWLGHLLASPLRRLLENPDSLVLPLVQEGARVLELGPGMGFFTVPVAHAVGPGGKVVCVDVQQAMLDSLQRRIEKRGLAGRVELRVCTQRDFGIGDIERTFDLALAIHVVHETIDAEATMTSLARSLKPGGRLLLMEPPGHCSEALFRTEEEAAEKAGMVREEHPTARRKMLRVWRKS